MANSDNPSGLSPIGGLGSGAFMGRQGRYHIHATDTTAAYVGGLVRPAGTADANGIMTVTALCTTAAVVVGVIVAVEPVTRDSTLHRAASTERYVYVADDPGQLFEVQDDGSSALTATVVGNVADLASTTSGSTITGRSAMELSTASVTATGDGSEDVMILGLVQRPSNAIGANARYVVRLLNHFYAQDTGA